MEIEDIAKLIVDVINKTQNDYDATDKTIEILNEHFESYKTQINDVSAN